MLVFAIVVACVLGTCVALMLFAINPREDQ